MTTKEYLKLPYKIHFRQIKDKSGEYYFATVQELDGCMSDGATLEEAAANIQEAMEGWIEAKLDGGFAVPLPLEGDTFSDRFGLSPGSPNLYAAL